MDMMLLQRSRAPAAHKSDPAWCSRHHRRSLSALEWVRAPILHAARPHRSPRDPDPTWVYPLHQLGGSLAGKDSMPASSTASRACAGETTGNVGAGSLTSSISDISDGGAVWSAGRGLRGMQT